MDEKQKTFIKLYKTYLTAKYDGQSFPVDSQKFERLDLSLDNTKDRATARLEAIDQYYKERSLISPIDKKVLLSLNEEMHRNEDLIKAFDQAMNSTKDPAAQTKTYEKYTDELRSFTNRNKIERDEIDKLYKGPTITFPENKPSQTVELTSLAIYEKDGQYMIGRERYFEEEKEWKITNDLSGPYESSESAKKDFEKIKEFRGLMDGIGTGNLKTIAASYEDRIEDDPKNEIKAGIIRDFIKHDRKDPEKEFSIEETRIIEFHTFR